MKLTIDQVDAKGQSSRTEWVGKIDGKDYPITGSPMLDTVSFKRIDALTCLSQFKGILSDFRSVGKHNSSGCNNGILKSAG